MADMLPEEISKLEIALALGTIAECIDEVLSPMEPVHRADLVEVLLVIREKLGGLSEKVTASEAKRILLEDQHCSECEIFRLHPGMSNSPSRR